MCSRSWESINVFKKQASIHILQHRYQRLEISIELYLFLETCFSTIGPYVLTNLKQYKAWYRHTTATMHKENTGA